MDNSERKWTKRDEVSSFAGMQDRSWKQGPADVSGSDRNVWEPLRPHELPDQDWSSTTAGLLQWRDRISRRVSLTERSSYEQQA